MYAQQRSTIGTVEVREDGSIDYSCTVAGDGTVSAKSGLNTDKLLSQSNEVDEGHMTLPLDGKAIEHTVDWIGRQLESRPPSPHFILGRPHRTYAFPTAERN